MTTLEEKIARTVLETYAGPFYVAGTPTQRDRILADARHTIRQIVIEEEGKQNKPCQIPGKG